MRDRCQLDGSSKGWGEKSTEKHRSGGKESRTRETGATRGKKGTKVVETVGVTINRRVENGGGNRREG